MFMRTIYLITTDSISCRHIYISFWIALYSVFFPRTQLLVSILTFVLFIKCTPVQALRLCTGRTTHRGRRGIALLFLDHGTRRGWWISVTPRPLFTPGKDMISIYRRLGGPQDRSGQVRKISLPPTGIRSSDRPACSQPLYRLSYRAHML